MFSSLAIGGQTLFAMLTLYFALALMSACVMLKTRARASPPSQLRQQINSWWLIFPFVSLSLVCYPLGPGLLVLLIGALALAELAPLLERRAAGWLVAGAVGLATLVLLDWLGPALAMLLITLCLPLLLAALAALFLLARSRLRLVVLLYALTCCGLGFVLAFMHLPLAPERQLSWLFYLFVLTALNDIGQFVFGKWLGKHKIAARVSPNKTWQGLAGGVGLSALLSLLLGRYLALADAAHLLGLGALLSLAGFCGDMLFSAAKRYLGLKDFSRLIPGHGGILDRVDSLVLTAPLLYYSLYFLPSF